MRLESALFDRRLAWRVVPLLLVLTLAGCASLTRWPAITSEPDSATTPGRWVWAELLTVDPEASRRFYADVFGWDIAPVGDAERSRYALARADGEPVAGILYSPKAQREGRSALWLGLMSVPSVPDALASVEAAGGETLVTPRRLWGRGEVALLGDPEGARFGVLRADGGDPPDRFPQPGHWLWHELWAKDGAAMAAFYAPVGGYQVEGPLAGEGPVERHLLSGGYPRAGIVDVPRNDLPSGWLHYIRVADLAATLRRAQAAGASVLLAPDPDIRQGRVAILRDPLGAAIGVAEWSEPADAGADR